jgi:hypothetical protein
MKQRIDEILRLLHDPQALQHQHPAFVIALQVEATLMQVIVMREYLGLDGDEREDEDEEFDVEQPAQLKTH